ncbi:hydrophobin 1 [Moniliophthora roreri MCA 2997]|uniref:Hydrophobin n=2 Tax=Moniliophthora roreri TaxID=221103 RepID=V2WT65_MONRO|nr:hydrophobin 1 [Moniliophthora roreri MCA 2997]KAI3609054.1 hydrophobin 1 [Moniliophthora roreri]
MQLKLIALAVLAALAVATPTRRGGLPASSCNTGPIQCCNTVTTAYDPTAAELFKLLGIVIFNPNILVGLTCNPITVIGIGGSECSSSLVCCENNSFGGVVSIGCVPVDLNL